MAFFLRLRAIGGCIGRRPQPIVPQHPPPQGPMPHLRYRDESRSRGALFLAIGALAGLAVGVLLAQRVGGLSALGSRLRDRVRRGTAELATARPGDYGDYASEADYDDELDYELS